VALAIVCSSELRFCTESFFGC